MSFKILNTICLKTNGQNLKRLNLIYDVTFEFSKHVYTNLSILKNIIDHTSFKM